MSFDDYFQNELLDPNSKWRFTSVTELQLFVWTTHKCGVAWAIAESKFDAIKILLATEVNTFLQNELIGLIPSVYPLNQKNGKWLVENQEND